MAGLQDFRKQHPEYNDMPDADLSDALYKKYYSDIPRADFDTKMGTTAASTPELPAQQAMMQNGPAVIPQPESALKEAEVGLARPIANIDRGVGYLTKKIGIDTGSDARYNSFAAHVNQLKRTGQVKDNSFPEEAAGMAETAPLALITKSPFLNSAGSAALTSNADSGLGVVRDAGIGGIAGKGAQLAAKAAGAIVSPRINSMAKYLMNKGVELTPGQILGGTTHKIESAVTSFPVPFVSDAMRRSYETFNNAAVNDTLAPIGAKLPDAIKAGHQAVEYAQNKLGDAYDKVIPNLTLKADPQWVADNGNLHNLAKSGLGADQLKRFAMQSKYVYSKFSPNGTMSGDAMKDVEETLGKEYKNYSTGGPADRDYADAIREYQAQIRDLAARSNPTQAANLQKINDGYAMLTRVERAAANTKDGVFTPSQFRSAVVQMDPSTRKRMSAAGLSIGQDLAKAGETVLPQTVPDSGTPFRHAVQLGAGALATGGLAGVIPHVNPLGAAAVVAALAPYTRTGGRVASKMLTARPPGATIARRVIDASAPLAAKASSIAETDHRNEVLPENR